MNLIEAIILGLVQGLTEFIPVSSSGHLVIMHQVLGVEHGGLTFDVALHLGTLLALTIFFYKDITRLIGGLLGKNETKRLAWLLIVATIPAAVAGFLLESAAESAFRSVNLVAINLMTVAVIMLIAEKFATRYSKKTKLEQTKTAQAAAIGLTQALAIVPGVSRSGITITTGLFAGLDRVAAARFSFLLSIPITAGAIVKVFAHEGTIATIQSESTIFLAGITTALLSGVFAIKFLMKFLSKHSLAAFAYYRIALAAMVLLFI